MVGNSKELLQLEGNNAPSIESTLLLCKSNDFLQSQATKPKPPDGKPTTSSIPKSQVLGKVRDFLGVMSEANKRLQLNAKDNSKDHDIEVLTGNESEYIEMDLMLGVAELHTPEAIAAAESAIAGYQPVISLAADCCGMDSDDSTKSEDSSDESNDDDNDDIDVKNNDSNDTCSPTMHKESKSAKDDSLSEPRKCPAKKRPRIIELS